MSPRRVTLLAGRRAGRAALLQRFTAGLGPAVATSELLLQLAESLHVSLGAAKAEVWAIEADELVNVVSVPHAGEGARHPLGERERWQLSKPQVFGAAWLELWLPALMSGRAPCSLRAAPVVNGGA